jgi:hypothetical protein
VTDAALRGIEGRWRTCAGGSWPQLRAALAEIAVVDGNPGRGSSDRDFLFVRLS